MLCDKCLNKNICKYYAFFADAPMIINIESCEKYSTKQISSSDDKHHPEQFIFKTPIDYSQFKQPEENITLLENEEEVERITVDLSQEHNDKVVSITDLLLGDDN